MEFEFGTTIDIADVETDVVVTADLQPGTEAKHIQNHDHPDFSDDGSPDEVTVEAVWVHNEHGGEDEYTVSPTQLECLDAKAAEYALEHRDDILTQNQE